MSALACPKRQRIRSGIKRKICASVLFMRHINRRGNGAWNLLVLLFDSGVWGKGGVRGGGGREREGGREGREGGTSNANRDLIM